MNKLVKYECLTATYAFNLVDYIADLGGSVCMIMNGIDPTSQVLTDYEFTESNEQALNSMGVYRRDLSDSDVEYFNARMK